MFKRYWWMFLVMLPVGALLGLLAAAVVTYVMPKMYESEAVIEVRPPSPMLYEGKPAAEMTPQFFFGTEFEKIKSRNSLEKVAADLDLANRWCVDKDSAVRILKTMVTTRQIRGTDLIGIRVRHTNKVDARDIAEAVVRNYKEYSDKMAGGADGPALPSDASVVIHEAPVISQVPVSPNVLLNLTLGTIAGLVLSPLMALPLVWLLHRMSPRETRS